ncbi:MAG: DUF1223 domain-containing protein [Bdellovibrionales bacterium]|nr:DUF1223 domain-containing protein [Bdellovibrionales bacterium]
MYFPIRNALCCLFVIFFALANVFAESPHPVVLELFTSQGCSSCPPADKLLGEIQKEAHSKRLPIYPLSFHVDYWNFLGWRDPYSRPFASERQRQYNAYLKAGVFTPQVIVNGSKSAIGSESELVHRLIQAELRQPPEYLPEIELSRVGSTVRLSGTLKGSYAKFINVAAVRNGGENFVSSGENSGSSLSHINVVVDFQRESVSQEGHRPFSIEVATSDQANGVLVYGEGEAMKVLWAKWFVLREEP